MKKILTFLLAVIMIAGTASIATFADVKPVTLKAPTTEASAGASLEIAITVDDIGPDGLSGALFEVTVDGGLEITKKVVNATGRRESIIDGSTARFAWAAEKKEQILKSGAVIATITVTVPANAKAGDSFNVIITPSDDPGDFFGGEDFTGAEDEISYGAVAQNGKVVISNVKKGDANGDGNITAKDIIMTMKYILNPSNPPKGFNLQAADMDNNGKINSKDIIAIMKEMLKKKYL